LALTFGIEVLFKKFLETRSPQTGTFETSGGRSQKRLPPATRGLFGRSRTLAPSHGWISSGDCALATKNGRTFTRHSCPRGVLWSA